MAAGREERGVGPLVVAVDGRSGAGKTRLAGGLRAELTGRGRSCAVVHLDDLYPGWSGLAAALPRLCAEVLEPLRGGRAGRFSSWDWLADRPGPDRVVPVREVVVVEGVGSGATACPHLVDLVVWLEVEEAVRRARALARDGDTFAPHWEDWAAQEERVFALRGGSEQADVVVDGAVVGPGTVRGLADRVEAALAARARA